LSWSIETGSSDTLRKNGIIHKKSGTTVKLCQFGPC